MITYTPDAHPPYGNAHTRLATVTSDGVMHPFGPTFATDEAVTSVAVRPDGAAVAVAVFHTAGPGTAEVRLIPMPGYRASIRTWKANQVNEIIDLSWKPAGTTLAYIAGDQTGAGIAGDPSFLNITIASHHAPDTSSWPPRYHCVTEAAAWLPSRPGMVVIRGCEGREQIVRVDPRTGTAQGPPLTLGDTGCLDAEIRPDAAGDTLLINWCEQTYIATRTQVALLSRQLQSAAWPGTERAG